MRELPQSKDDKRCGRPRRRLGRAGREWRCDSPLTKEPLTPGQGARVCARAAPAQRGPHRELPLETGTRQGAAPLRRCADLATANRHSKRGRVVLSARWKPAASCMRARLVLKDLHGSAPERRVDHRRSDNCGHAQAPRGRRAPRQTAVAATARYRPEKRTATASSASRRWRAAATADRTHRAREAPRHRRHRWGHVPTCARAPLAHTAVAHAAVAPRCRSTSMLTWAACTNGRRRSTSRP